MAASEENKLSPSFSGFKSKNFLHECSYDGVSGTDSEEQSLKSLSKCLLSLAVRSVLLISKRQYTSCNASCKRRVLIIEDEFKILAFADYCKPSYL